MMTERHTSSKTHGLVHGAGSPIEGCNAPETRPGERVLSAQLQRGMVGVREQVSRPVCHRQVRGLCAQCSVLSAGGLVAWRPGGLAAWLRPVAPFRCHG